MRRIEEKARQLEPTRKCMIRRIPNMQGATSVTEDDVNTMLCKEWLRMIHLSNVHEDMKYTC